MTLFRSAILILIFSAIGIGIVYLRRCNWNYAHKTNILYDKYRKTKLEYIKNRIELAHMKSPHHLLKKLKSLPLQLQPDNTNIIPSNQTTNQQPITDNQ